MTNKSVIGFIGSGWGAVAAVSGLKKAFNLYCLSNDEDVKGLLGPADVLVNHIDDMKTNVVVMAGNKRIISANQLSSRTFINIHYALLPKYRGLHALAWAVLNDEAAFGLSVHLASERIDAGPIIYQYALKNDFQSSLTAITQQLNQHISTNIASVVQDFLMGNIIPKPQDEASATYVCKRDERHNIIRFDHDERYYRNLLRVLQPPYPYPTVSYHGQIFVVKKARFQSSHIITEPGRIANIDETGIWVFVKDSYIILEELITIEGKPLFWGSFKIGDFFDV